MLPASGLYDGQRHVLRPEGGGVHCLPVFLRHAVAPGDGVESQVIGLRFIGRREVIGIGSVPVDAHLYVVILPAPADEENISRALLIAEAAIELLNLYYEVIQEDTKMSTLFSGIVSDIYEYAKEYDADYYDIKNGYIYHVQEYNRLVGLGIKNAEIRITDEFGNHVGYAKRIKES